MRKISIALGLAGLAALSGCRSASSRGPAYRPVSEADFGRLEAGQTGPVDAARADLALARDEVARAERRAADARHEIEFARADETAARAERERATAEMRVAHESADPRALARAQDLADGAEIRSRAAAEHLAYAQRLVEARDAARDATRARVALAEAALERARLAALEQAGIPAASKYDPRPLDALEAERRRAFDARRARAAHAERLAQDALARWRAQVDRWQARAQGARDRG
jgi:hypothetical protein